MDLQGAHAFLTTQHKVDYLEPNLQGIIRVLKNRSHQDRKPITPLRRTATLPMPGAGMKLINLIVTAPWTSYAIRPATVNKVGFAGVLSGKSGFQFSQCHLFGDLGFHRESPLTIDD
jgi:hypothetical protein